MITKRGIQVAEGTGFFVGIVRVPVAIVRVHFVWTGDSQDPPTLR